jgi:NAD(P)-dependent dehydrogenase (short-subunit alcohol dehydrogenase family)
VLWWGAATDGMNVTLQHQIGWESRMRSQSKVVLITGASSGIGAATAERLARAGHNVYATARHVAALKSLEALGCKALALDEASIVAAVAEVVEREGTIGALVNNAGYSQSGALEPMAISAVRKQFETNVFGLLRLTQEVLPIMRKARAGRVVNLSSMGGKLTFPGGGAYHATKYAVEALSDALRFEVRGFGIDVVIVQPGLIRSGFADAAIGAIDQSNRIDPYAAFDVAVAKATREVYHKGALAKLGGEPDDVAKVIENALAATKPKARYTVTASAKMMLAQRAMMPDSLWDAFLRQNFPTPGVAE